MVLDDERILELTQIAIDGLFGQFKDCMPKGVEHKVVFNDSGKQTKICWMGERGGNIGLHASDHGDEPAFKLMLWLRKHADIGQFGTVVSRTPH